jgi:hypothetical protein
LSRSDDAKSFCPICTLYGMPAFAASNNDLTCSPLMSSDAGATCGADGSPNAFQLAGAVPRCAVGGVGRVAAGEGVGRPGKPEGSLVVLDLNLKALGLGFNPVHKSVGDGAVQSFAGDFVGQLLEPRAGGMIRHGELPPMNRAAPQ